MKDLLNSPERQITVLKSLRFYSKEYKSNDKLSFNLPIELTENQINRLKQLKYDLGEIGKSKKFHGCLHCKRLNKSKAKSVVCEILTTQVIKKLFEEKKKCAYYENIKKGEDINEIVKSKGE